MTTLENLNMHLNSIPLDAWEELFDLLPEIESTTEFGTLKGMERMPDDSLSGPYWEPSDVVFRFTGIVLRLGITPVFDWGIWQEGKDILSYSAQDFSIYDTITLCKLFTLMIRADRFNEGFLIQCFKKGNVKGIILALEKKIRSNLER
jgi:hypothetical protein